MRLQIHGIETYDAESEIRQILERIIPTPQMFMRNRDYSIVVVDEGNEREVVRLLDKKEFGGNRITVEELVHRDGNFVTNSIEERHLLRIYKSRDVQCPAEIKKLSVYFGVTELKIRTWFQAQRSNARKAEGLVKKGNYGRRASGLTLGKRGKPLKRLGASPKSPTIKVVLTGLKKTGQMLKDRVDAYVSDVDKLDARLAGVIIEEPILPMSTNQELLTSDPATSSQQTQPELTNVQQIVSNEKTTAQQGHERPMNLPRTFPSPSSTPGTSQPPFNRRKLIPTLQSRTSAVPLEFDAAEDPPVRPPRKQFLYKKLPAAVPAPLAPTVENLETEQNGQELPPPFFTTVEFKKKRRGLLNSTPLRNKRINVSSPDVTPITSNFILVIKLDTSSEEDEWVEEAPHFNKKTPVGRNPACKSSVMFSGLDEDMAEGQARKQTRGSQVSRIPPSDDEDSKTDSEESPGLPAMSNTTNLFKRPITINCGPRIGGGESSDGTGSQRQGSQGSGSVDVDVQDLLSSQVGQGKGRGQGSQGSGSDDPDVEETPSESSIGGITNRRERLPDAVLFSNDNLVQGAYHLKNVLHNLHPSKHFSQNELKMLQCHFNVQIKKVLDEAGAETGHPLGVFRFRALEGALRKHGHFHGGECALLTDMGTFLSPKDYRKVKGLVIPDDDSNDTDPQNWDTVKKPKTKNLY